MEDQLCVCAHQLTHTHTQNLNDDGSIYHDRTQQKSYDRNTEVTQTFERQHRPVPHKAGLGQQVFWRTPETQLNVISEVTHNAGLLKMKAIFLAFLFATILGSATLIVPPQEVSAQQSGATLVVKKVVEGSPPPSDWVFDLGLNVPPYSSTITIDRTGGETTIVFTVTQVGVTIVERTKTNYVAYVSYDWLTTLTQTHVAFVGTGRLIDQRDTVTVAFINQNTFTTSAEPVGGFVEPVNKLAVFTPSLALFAVMMAIVVFAAMNRKTPES